MGKEINTNILFVIQSFRVKTKLNSSELTIYLNWIAYAYKVSTKL